MRFCLLTILTAPLVLLGCGEEPTIQTYDVDKPAHAAPQSTSGPVVVDGLRIEVPTGWTSRGSSSFVLADFRSSNGLRLTVSKAGGDLKGNIDRWRGQLGLKPLAGSVDPADLQTIQSEAGPIWVVDLVADQASEQAQRFRVGLLAESTQGVPTGQMWFFKLVGPNGLIEGQREAFDGLLKKLQWVEESAGPNG